MDTRPADYLRHRIARFSWSIKETQMHYSPLSPAGNYPASAPYYEQQGILELFRSLEADAETRDGLWQEFTCHREQLNALEAALGEPFRHALRKELSACMDMYSAAICHAQLGLLDVERDHELFPADRIAVLVRELGKDHDMSGAKQLFVMLQKNLAPREPGHTWPARKTGSPLPVSPAQVPADNDTVE
ncbi:MAG: hypothetical protein GYA23_05960 [Methanomicrobiales archaeon]|nr:hypothetical protein [Methanomicrobiales archaeon]